ncbi:MAG: hypothetical protein AAFV53_09655 [Myxococcota bacterium]
MKRRIGALLFIAGLMLACGGLVEGTTEQSPLLIEEGPQVSERVASLGAYLSGELSAPCQTVAQGQSFEFDGFTMVTKPTELSTGEDRLPWIKNGDERSKFKRGMKGLVVPMTITNNAPVARKPRYKMKLWTVDGEWTYAAPGNSGLWARDHGGIDSWEMIKVGPGQSIDTALVFPVTDANAEQAAMQLFLQEKQRDANNRPITVTTTLVLVDVGAPTPGPHINPEKRSSNTK